MLTSFVFRSVRSLILSCITITFFVAFAGSAVAQSSANATSDPPPVTFTTDQDHQNMMDQLGIKALRPGPSGNEADPNHANYDPATANPYPDYPDALTMKDGQKVTTPAMWWTKRRPEIVEDMSREEYGRLPRHVPKVTWTVEVNERERMGFTPVIAKKLIGHVDNSSYPAINVDIQMVVVTPANATGPVPVLMMFGRAALPAPVQPTEDELEQINGKLKAMLSASDPEMKKIFDKYPAYEPILAPPFAGFGGFRPGQPPPPPSREEELIAAGWGYAELNPASVQADNGAGLTRGIIGLVNKGQPRKPDDWGSLRAWAWGAARGLDYLETDSAVDAKHVGIEGVSRYGKAALVTMAYEPRFYMGLIGSSGKGGATPMRRNWGEAVENLTGAGEYHWMAGNFLKYGASDATFGSKTAKDLPVDSNELIALCAPRLVFISYGIPEKGDAKWLDHQGSYMATVAAGEVYRLLGAKDIGVTEDYHIAKMPGVNVGLLDGELAWRQDDGGHTDAPNMPYFIQWADKFIPFTSPAPRR